MATLTWLGHSAFRLETDGGKHVYIDPFLTGNPTTPEAEKTPERVDVIAVTHGHSDHVGDTVELSKRFPDAEIVCQIELKKWLGGKGANVGGLPGINKGGSQVIDGITFTMTDARHSSSSDEGEYLGESAGFVITLESGVPVYFAGDTSVFGDMRLIAELYRPTIGFLPIGDHYTMGPMEAAKACELLGLRQVVPMHFGTFPVLTGTPARLRELVEPRGVQVLELKPGETAS